uniref:Uncharacterized protein n=1 Tax=Eutreptiella gymnastica TaxID=73025 RepID=A0A7S1HT40_9EUGL
MQGLVPNQEEDPVCAQPAPCTDGKYRKLTTAQVSPVVFSNPCPNLPTTHTNCAPGLKMVGGEGEASSAWGSGTGVQTPVPIVSKSGHFWVRKNFGSKRCPSP